MKKTNAVLSGLLVLVALWCGALAAPEGAATGGKAAEQKLVEGNQRYVAASMAHPHQTAQRRADVAHGQQPFAAIFGCSDSRVPPEVIFDQGLGDLFVVRAAGHVLDTSALASLEYAVEHLGIRYIVVLGHTRCGAVESALKGGAEPGHIGTLLKALQPAVEKTKNHPGDPLDNAVKANIALAVQHLRTAAPLLDAWVKKGELTIVGACYDFDTGAVHLLP